MRSCALWIALSAVLTGGALAEYTPVNVEAGAAFTFSVVTFMQEPEKCFLDGPHIDTINFTPGEEGQLTEKVVQLIGNEMSRCTVTLLNISPEDAGYWTIYFTSSGVERTQVYKVEVNGAATEVTPESTSEETIQETTQPDEAIEDYKPAGEETVDREIEMLDEQHINSKIGSSETVSVAKVDFVEGQGCSIKTPDGIEHPFALLNIPGVEIVEENNVECGVIIQVTTENIGQWMLLAQAKRFGYAIEKRLPFTISVEEFVYPVQSQITVTEGNDLYLSLRDSIDSKYYGTCGLTAPSSSETTFETRLVNNNNCQFYVSSVNKDAAGTWRISYGDSVIYYTHIDIYVTERTVETQGNLDWITNRPVNVTVGPENAIYCRVADPSGFVVFDGFGRCLIDLERATTEHNGYWKLTIGLAGQVQTEEQTFLVAVKHAAPKAAVLTTVSTDKPAVMVSCSVNTSYEVRACKFRNPQGKILIASPGIGDDDYIFHESANYESNVHSHDCGIRMNNPSTSDLGLWRCAIETDEEIYYGFLPVLCPWSLSIPEIAATVVQVPTLTAVATEVTREEGESVTMSCSVQSPIRYCYFRAGNGTTFSVSPDTSSPANQYVGAGFDAGECGIRFDGLVARDSGRWSCHVGFPDSSEAEQRVNIQVTVEEAIDAYVTWDNQNNLLVEAKVNGGPQLEYCRFVRIDGFGFTTENMPPQYYTNYALQYGVCGIVIPNPTMLDRHPWTVAAKVVGRDMELSQSTDHALHSLLPVVEEPGRSIPAACLWFMIIFFSLLILSVGICFGPKKNREWTFARVTRLRTSFRNSIKKQPLTEKPLPTQQV